MVTGARATSRMVPEFLTGPPKLSRDNTQCQNPGQNDSLSTTLPVLEIPPVENSHTRFIKRVADVLDGMNNNSTSALMVRPVSTTT